MPSLVSTALMDSTWRSVGGSSSTAIARMQKQCGKDQQELTGFVIGFTSDLEPEALGLALYVHLVVAEAFRRSGTRFRKIKPGKIERTWSENFGLINDLKARGYTRSTFSFPTELTSEPAVLQYIVDALTEESDVDPVAVDIDSFWHILQVLKTVSDCMHDAGQ